MARKKQHLKYQAKKGRLQTETQAEEPAKETGKPKVRKETQAKSKAQSTTAPTQQEFTKLPESETRFVRKEIVYISFIALVLVLVYIAIFLVFRYSGIDEWLSGLIQLTN